jgi:hypothetical protein
VSAVEVHVTHEPNYGVCCGEIDSQWGCFSLHIAVEPPFKVFVYCPNALLPKEALNMGFKVIRYAFI